MPNTSKYQNVLIVDDDDIYNHITSKVLEISVKSQNIEKKMSGLTALRYLDRLHADDFPGLIILDLNMPVVTGRNFLEQYAERFATNFPEKRILVVTAAEDEEGKEEVLSYPFVLGYLTKPFDVEAVKKILGVL